MARPNGKQTSFTITGTSEADVMTAIYGSIAHARRGLTAFVHSSQAGTAKVYYVDQSSNAREIGSQALSADDFVVFDFDYPVPEAKVTFNADSGSGTVIVEAFGY